ncbi:MAG: VCBS repeat-containing protein [Deltaproteobacteria bacterium]|nr:VCBS repeat-containing protein [Deltaproteobacteria bacterium]
MRTMLLLVSIMLLAQGAAADVPFPTCADAGCSDPRDFGSYLFVAPGQLPNDFDPAAKSSWKYNPRTGMDVVSAWQISTGRPDVVVAVLDSGIRWHARDVARKVALNKRELPPPPGCEVHDCNGDGFVSVDDYAGILDANGNGLLDGQDLILAYSDGIDDDRNGYVDDIAGWDFADGDNDPEDLVDYGHGTGEAEDSTGEANNGGGMPGVAPNVLFMPLKVADSFVAFGTDFAQAVVYATENGAAVVQEALGAIGASPSSQAAIDFAYRHGVPIMASAADESSRHHNFPAVLDHTIWLNSIVHGDGDIVEQEDEYDLLNGCTNFGGRAWVAISSNSCSSEATGRGAGLAALLVSHGRNLVDAGLLSPYPGLTDRTPFSAEEIRQLLRRSALDIDHSADLFDLPMNPLFRTVLSAPLFGLFFGSERYPTQSGWDQFTGYGKPDAGRLLAIGASDIPPEADLSGGLRWFDSVDPVQSPEIDVLGSAAAVRAGGSFDYLLEVGCGVQPSSFHEISRGSADEPLRSKGLGGWHPAATAEVCGFDPAATIDDPDAHTVTLRLQVTDRNGLVGEDRRTVAVHTDTTLAFPVLALGSSAEGSPALADLNRDGVLDIVYGTADGSVHAWRGDSGEELTGFPVRTPALPVHRTRAYRDGEVPVPHEMILAATAADDLDGDGRVEVVVATVEGRVFVYDDHGRLRRGFPVSTDPAFSDPANRDPLNDTDPGIFAAPTLVDLDAPGPEPQLEIVVAAMDGHLYAWRANGETVDGFPVRIADTTKVDIDPATGHATPRAAGVQERGAKLIGSPAVGDLDGDGRAEILVPSNEEYGGEPNGFARESTILQLLSVLDVGLDFDFSSRLYAVKADGTRSPGGPFVQGWPVRVPLLVPGLLPTIGTGAPGSPALADLDGNGRVSAAFFSTAGPAMLWGPDGLPRLGEVGGVPRAFAVDFPAPGFPAISPTAVSGDAPLFPAVGSGAFGDLTGDGLPEYVAPTLGLRKLFDTAGPALQTFGDHQITAWDTATGTFLPAFPSVMDDLMFLTSPSIADVDGDGTPEILQGSGVYMVRAFRADGSQAPDFPKFTHGWLISAPTAGDVDGDGLIELVAATREGNLYVWNTPAAATEAAIPWQGFGRDRRNTQNHDSGVSPLAIPRSPADGLTWEVEALQQTIQVWKGTSLQRRLKRQARKGLKVPLRLLRRGRLDIAADRLAGLARRLEDGGAAEVLPDLLASIDALAEQAAAATEES